jgi:hypothetical protein
MNKIITNKLASKQEQIIFDQKNLDLITDAQYRSPIIMQEHQSTRMQSEVKRNSSIFQSMTDVQANNLKQKEDQSFANM